MSAFAMHSHLAQLQAQQNLSVEQSKSVPVECTCGARAFLQDRQRKRKRITPLGGVASVVALKAQQRDAEKLQNDPQDEQPVALTRKRSLWRKILGKGPKCICVASEKKPKVIQIPSDYEGCLTVRVAGKRVAYTRDMQLVKRRSYTPLDSITEDEEDY